MNIIGISGYAGSGKDTFADMLLEQDGFVKVSLADPIKRFAMDVWGFTVPQLWGESKYRNAPDYRYEISRDNFLTPRKALQQIGTEVARSIDPNVWICYAIRVSTALLTENGLCYSKEGGLDDYWMTTRQGEFERIEGFPENVKAVVIPDVRFVNEFNAIKETDGILIRIKRPNSGLSVEYAKHASEAEMESIPDSEFDIIINNNGTLDDLRNTLYDLVLPFITA